MTAPIAEAIDSSRRKSLFASREAIAELEEWESVIQSRQAIPFLRVFGSEEVLDGTLVHPEDYALARKLAKSLEIELPPNSPPGYSPPKFDTESEPSKPAQLTEVESQPQPPAVEDFSSAENEAPEFQVGEAEATEGATEEAKQTETSAAEAAETAAIDTETSPGAIAETETAGDGDQDAEVAVESDAEQSVTAELGGQSDPAAATEVEPDSSTSDPTDAGKASTAVAAPEIHPSVKRPIPEKAKIDKCVKEWQIGSNRANQIVHWLCDPFGDSDASGTPPAVLSYMPATKELKPGDPVIGVVVSVMPFGVFVELAPDCSGLIHVSRISESFVEDLHEAVQVGDVVTAWVIGTDEKRRRVALSAISPERAQELEEQRHARSDRGRFRDTRQTRPGPRGDKRGQTSGGDRSQGGRESAGKAAAGAAGRGGRGKPQGKSNDGRRDRGRQGGRGQGGGRDRGRGGRGRERKPESYRVESKEEVKPISEEMQQGKEPMRTFGDLAQFFGKPETADKPTADQAAGKPIEQAAPPEQPANPPEAESTSESAPKPDSVTAPESVPVQGAAQEPEPTAEFSSESTPKVSPSVTETAAESPDSESSSPDSAATDAQTS
jgi:predicted RNA-binding protein with RPS1 domain